MKRIMIAAVLGLAAIGSANAMTSNGHLSHFSMQAAQSILPGASFDGLTAVQAAQVEGIISSENEGSGYDAKAALKKVLAN